MQVSLELMDAVTGFTRLIYIAREARSREEMFEDRLDGLLSSTGTPDSTIVRNLREALRTCREGDVRPNIIVVGPTGSGKSSLVNTGYAAMNEVDGTIAPVSDGGVMVAGGLTHEYVRFEGVVAKANAAGLQPFTLADTCGLSLEMGAREEVVGALRNVIKGRYKNGARMDNGWRNVRAMQDPKKRTHGIILCLNAREELSLPILQVPPPRMPSLGSVVSWCPHLSHALPRWCAPHITFAFCA